MQIHGWELFAHSLLLDQIERLVRAVERDRARRPKTYSSGANFKVLASLRRLMFDTIPAEPGRQEYRQGATLGEHRKHWFRAKFGGQRFRLFFRFDSKQRVIIYAWVNDCETLRTYGAKNDAYAVFRKMLDKGNPPDDLAALLQTARDPAASDQPALASQTRDAAAASPTAAPAKTSERE